MIHVVVFSGAPENAVDLGAKKAQMTAPPKVQRRRDFPAAISGLIEGRFCSVNAFRVPWAGLACVEGSVRR